MKKTAQRCLSLLLTLCLFLSLASPMAVAVEPATGTGGAVVQTLSPPLAEEDVPAELPVLVQPELEAETLEADPPTAEDFVATFDTENDRGGWKKESGAGAIAFTNGTGEAGFATLSVNSANSAFVAENAPALENGFVEADITPIGVNQQFALAFHYASATSYAAIGYDKDLNWLWLGNGGDLWGSSSLSTEHTPVAGTKLHLRIEYVGKEVRVLVDGDEIFSGELPSGTDSNSTDTLPTSGKCGFRTWGSGNNNSIKIDNVKMGALTEFPTAEYAITVKGGTANPTTAAVGATISIAAGTAPKGTEFLSWGSSDGISFADAETATTTFTMPAKAVTVTANYANPDGTLSVPVSVAATEEDGEVALSFTMTESENLLTNGGFEDGTKGYTNLDACTIVSGTGNVAEGQNALKLTGYGGMRGPGVASINGGVYTFSFQGKREGGTEIAEGKEGGAWITLSYDGKDYATPITSTTYKEMSRTERIFESVILRATNWSNGTADTKDPGPEALYTDDMSLTVKQLANGTQYYASDVATQGTAPALSETKPAEYRTLLVSGDVLVKDNGGYINIVEVNAENKVVGFQSVKVTVGTVKNYPVTVVSGTATPAEAPVNGSVQITANAAPAGTTFGGWTTADGVTFADATAATTTFKMPAKAVTVTATYDYPAGTTFYVDSAAGNDANTGTTASAPWKTLAKVNALTLKAGDRVLLKAGSVFEGESLSLRGLGSKEKPIQVDMYNGATIGAEAGAKPHIKANGVARADFSVGAENSATTITSRPDVAYGVHVKNVSHIRVNNLEISNNSGTRQMAVGVVVEAASGNGLTENIHLKNLYVHDVYGTLTEKTAPNGGIYMITTPGAVGTGHETRYHDISVENCTVKNVSRTGISVGSSHSAFYWEGYKNGIIPEEVKTKFGHTGVVIRNNYVEKAGGDAIVPQFCIEPLIEYNISNAASQNTPNGGEMYNAAIWPWRCEDALFQFNEAYDTLYNGDGQAYDCDSSRGTTYQYNYSHDNGGGFILLCQSQSVQSTVRYNISQNDLGRIFLLSNTTPAEIYNNTFYLRDGLNTRIMDGNTPSNLTNNIFYQAGTPRSANWGRFTYDSNLFFGFTNTPTDPNKVVADPLFVDPGKGGDGVEGNSANDTLGGYIPCEGSPAIGAGKVIADNGGRDYAGVTVSSTAKPNIGAMEAADESLYLRSDDHTIVESTQTILVVGSVQVADLLGELTGNDGADISAKKGGQPYTNGLVDETVTVVISRQAASKAYTVRMDTTARETMKVWTTNSYINPFQDFTEETTPMKGETIDLLMAGNDDESAQILLRSDSRFKIEDVIFTDLTKGTHKIPSAEIRYNFVDYHLMSNSAGQSRETTVRWGTDEYPDRLSNEPIRKVAAGKAQSVWITVHAPKDTPAGTYTGTATVKTNAGEYTVNISAEVIFKNVPQANDAAYELAYWQNISGTWNWSGINPDRYIIDAIYGTEKWSAKWWEYVESAAETMEQARVNVLHVMPLELLIDGGSDYDATTKTFTFNWTKFDEYVDFFLQRGGIKSLELYHLLNTVYSNKTQPIVLIENPNYSATGGNRKLVVVELADYFDEGTEEMTEQVSTFYDQYIKALDAHLKTKTYNGKTWLSMAFQHVEDEAISDREKKEYAHMAAFFAERTTIPYGDPVDAGSSVDFMRETTPLQFPLSNIFDNRKDAYAEDIAENPNSVMMYTCLNPQGNALNKFVDKPVWQMRLQTWYSYAVDVTGHLHWAWDAGWSDASKADAAGIERVKDLNEFNYKGDDFVVWPDVKNNKVASSIRAASIRDGAEDYEIYHILGEENPDYKTWVQTQIDKVVQSNTSYTSDVEALMKTRATIYSLAAGNLDIYRTVTFDGNGGTTLAPKKVVAETTMGALPTDPSYPGYHFVGWNTQKDGSGTAFTAKTPVAENVTVYAQWVSANDIVSFTVSGVSGQLNAAQHTVTVVLAKGSDLTALAPVFTLSEGATASPASGAAQDFTAPVTYTVTADDTTAQAWTVTITTSDGKTDRTVTWNAMGGTGAPESLTVADGAVPTVPTVVPTKTGYTFAGWYRDERIEIPWNFAADQVTANVTLCARWKLDPVRFEFATATGDWQKVDGKAFTGTELKDDPDATDGKAVVLTGITQKLAPVLKDAGSFANGSYEIRVKTTGIGAGIGLVFRTPGENSYYNAIHFKGATQNNALLTDVVLPAPYESTWADPWTEAKQPIEKDRYYTIKIDFRGQEMTVTVDGEEIITNDSSWKKFGAEPGYVGLYQWGSETKYYVDYIAVTPAEACTVRFDTQGGSEVAPLEGTLEGDKIAQPADPAKSGFTFDGWYKDAACTQVWNFATDRVTSNTVIFAGWSEIPLTPAPAPGPKPQPPVTEEGKTTVVTEVKPSVNGDKATAKVSDKTIQNAVNSALEEAKKTGSSANITLKINAPADAKSVETSLSAKSIALLAADATGGLAITGPVADITFDAKALAAIAESTQGTVSITAAIVPETGMSAAQKALTDGTAVYDFTVTSGDPISDFKGGTATITLPYTLAEGGDPSFVTVWHLDDASAITPVKGVYSDGKVTFTVEHFSRYAVGYLPFADLKTDWSYGGIVYAYNQNILTGLGGNTFGPEGKMTRAMILTALHRMSGKATEAQGETWYTNAVAWAVKAGISDGTHPERDVTRQELATILFRYAGVMGVAPTGSWAVKLNYADTAEIAEWAVESAMFMQLKGVIAGKDGNRFDPLALATRAEVATMLQRFANITAE